MLGRRAPVLGIIVFFGVTFVLTSASVHEVARMAPTTIWRAALAYVLAVGWQPLVAVWIVRTTVDALPSGHSYGEQPRSYMQLAVALPVMLIVAAAIVQAALGPTTPHPAPDEPPGSSLAGFAAAVGVLWLQALVEEVTWRGYLMPRLMQTLGAWPGLCVHGLLWGACYAPLLSWGRPDGQAHLLGFIVTLGLLGTVLGWLRLASMRVTPSAACNAILTIGAGLPLLLRGTTPLLGAVFEPAGWLPMLLFLATVATQPALRRAVSLHPR